MSLKSLFELLLVWLKCALWSTRFVCPPPTMVLPPAHSVLAKLPRPPPSLPRLTVVLDLDETLVFARPKPNTSYDVKVI